MSVSAEPLSIGPYQGDHELSISGVGSSDRTFNSGGFSVSGDLGRYVRRNVTTGLRQNIHYTRIRDEDSRDEFWLGATRGYLNYHFLTDRARPFVGGSIGGLYGKGVRNSGFAGLETGMKYYLQHKTFFLTRIEYQLLFSGTREASDAFQDRAAWVYTLGFGYNF